MNTLVRPLTTFLLLTMLSACAGAPKPTASPTSPISSVTMIASGHLSPALTMNMERAAHTATLLPDGRVLIAGGFREEDTSEVPIASAEIYDPKANTFTLTGDMNEPRDGHTATLLPNGQVLIAGGWGPNGRTATAELYDPATGKFRYAASMAGPRQGMTATLLNNGKVLIAGGDSARNTPQLTAEIYDPATNTFAQTGSLNSGRSIHTATLLRDGQVLLVGGHASANTVLASAEIYNPTTGTFTLTGSMSVVRYKHAAVLLSDGNVLVIGGSNQQDWKGKYTSVERYDANTGRFTRIVDLNGERFKLIDAAVRMNNGNVFVSGGNRQVEIFDALTQRFIVGVKLDDDYYSSVVTLLQDSRVLITGGYDSRIQPSNKAWIYN